MSKNYPVYCGYKEVVPYGKRRGTMRECYDTGQLRYYGRYPIDENEMKKNPKNERLRRYVKKLWEANRALDNSRWFYQRAGDESLKAFNRKIYMKRLNEQRKVEKQIRDQEKALGIKLNKKIIDKIADIRDELAYINSTDPMDQRMITTAPNKKIRDYSKEQYKKIQERKAKLRRRLQRRKKELFG